MSGSYNVVSSLRIQNAAALLFFFHTIEFNVKADTYKNWTQNFHLCIRHLKFRSIVLPIMAWLLSQTRELHFRKTIFIKIIFLCVKSMSRWTLTKLISKTSIYEFFSRSLWTLKSHVWNIQLVLRSSNLLLVFCNRCPGGLWEKTEVEPIFMVS